MNEFKFAGKTFISKKDVVKLVKKKIDDIIDEKKRIEYLIEVNNEFRRIVKDDPFRTASVERTKDLYRERTEISTRLEEFKELLGDIVD